MTRLCTPRRCRAWTQCQNSDFALAQARNERYHPATMRLHFITPAAAFMALSTVSAQAATADISIASFAHAHQLRATQLTPENAVELAGVAMRIVLRPGDQIAEINGRLETLPAAPYVRRGELFVSAADSHRLAILADSPKLAVSGPLAQAPDGNTTPNGAVTLDITPVLGSQTLAVAGHAPAGSAVTLTAYVTISRDLPDVVLHRRTVRVNDAGTFSTIVPIAPGFFPEAIVTVVATARPSGTSVSARYTVGPPNVTVPPDNLPYNVR
jgi:hypothetical protein